MFGISITPWDIATFVAAVLVTIYVIAAENPYPPSDRNHEGIRLCRVGLALAFWSIGFGLLGFVFALVAFILGILGIVKGRTAYGIVVIVLSVLFPAIGLMATVISLFRQ